jgi:hypothetical protein
VKQKLKQLTLGCKIPKKDQSRRDPEKEYFGLETKSSQPWYGTARPIIGGEGRAAGQFALPSRYPIPTATPTAQLWKDLTY